MHRPYFNIALICLFLATACTHRDQGAAIGGVAGGLGGYLVSKDKNSSTQIVSMIAGAVIGGMIGGAIGSYMDKSDQERVQKALHEVPTDKSRSWTNSKTGNRFTIKPISDIEKDENGKKYREAILFAREKGSDKLDATTKKMYL
jgi:surface antigen